MMPRRLICYFSILLATGGSLRAGVDRAGVDLAGVDRAGVDLAEEEGSILGDRAPWRKKQNSGSVLNSWMVDVEAGYLWKVGGETPLEYSLASSVISLRSPAVKQWRLENGDHVIYRSQFSLIGDAFQEGPESRYIAFSAAPSLEYWWSDLKTSVFLSVGGGFGFVDSTGVFGAQGQDFTFNWFFKTGVRRKIWEDAYLSAGVLFQHLSNTGLTDPNPGLDAMGPYLGLSFRF